MGEDPASQVYVRNKAQRDARGRHALVRAQAAGRHSEADAARADRRLNRRADVHGILVQLPLPAQIDAAQVIEAIDPAKDVDGFHPVNVGRLAAGAPALAPCTPTGLRDARRVRAADLGGWRRW